MNLTLRLWLSYLVLLLIIPKSILAMQVGDVFDLHSGEREAGTFLLRRSISYSSVQPQVTMLDTFIFSKKSYVVWQRGPKVGRVYKIIEKGASRFYAPSLSELYARLDNVIDQIVTDADPEKQKSTLVYFAKFVVDVLESKYGDMTPREAQYFSFTERDNAFLKFYLRIQNFGISRWISSRMTASYLKTLVNKELEHEENTVLRSAYRDFLDSFNQCEIFLEDLGLLLSNRVRTLEEKYHLLPNLSHKLRTLASKVKEKIETVQLMRSYIYFSKHYYRLDDTVPVVRQPKIFLTHGTFSDKIPEIIELGRLASPDYAAGKGLLKVSGGESGRGLSTSRMAVSFWGSADGDANLYLGYGDQIANEYPVTFAVGELHAHDPNCFNRSRYTLPGEITGEVKYFPFVSLKCIDYVFVPPFAVKEIKNTLEDHHWGEIQVLPYGYSISHRKLHDNDHDLSKKFMKREYRAVPLSPAFQTSETSEIEYAWIREPDSFRVGSQEPNLHLCEISPQIIKSLNLSNSEIIPLEEALDQYFKNSIDLWFELEGSKLVVNKAERTPFFGTNIEGFQCSQIAPIQTTVVLFHDSGAANVVFNYLNQIISTQVH